MCYWNRKCCAKVGFDGLLKSWERWKVVVCSWFDHSFVVELVGARALTAGLEHSQNWLWRTSFRALRSLVVSLVLWQLTKWRCRLCIGEDGVMFMLLLEEIQYEYEYEIFIAQISQISQLHVGYKGSQRVLIWYASHTPQIDELSLVLWSTVSQNLRPLGACGSTSHFVNNGHSRVKTRGVSCIGGFGQTDGQRKFELGIPQSRGVSYIRGASYIGDKTVISTTLGRVIMALDCNSLIHDEHFYDENSWVCWGNNDYWLVTERTKSH